MAKKGNDTSKILNKRAKFDYELSDEIIAGLVLNGRETKALRLKHANLRGAFVSFKDGELWLNNATITSTKGFTIETEEQTIPRKLLVKKREIELLKKAKDEGKTIVPVEILTKGRYIKVKIAAGKGKKNIDKRKIIQKRDLERDSGRKFKRQN